MAGSRGGTRIGAKRKSGGRREPSARGSSLVAALTLVIFALSLAVTFPPSPRFVPTEEPVFQPVTWAPPGRADVVTRGTALSQVLDSRGFDSGQIREITRLLEDYRRPRALRSGTALRFAL